MARRSCPLFVSLAPFRAVAMSEGLMLRPPVLAARTALLEGQQKLRQQHDQGSPGIQVCAKLTDLADAVVAELFAAAIADLAELDSTAFGHLSEQVALVALVV